VEPKTKQKLANAAGGYSRTLLQLLATKKQFGSRCRQSYAPNGDFWRRNKNRRNGKAFFVCASGSTGSESHSPGFGETRRWKRWKLKIPIRNPANWHPKKTQKATWQRLLFAYTTWSFVLLGLCRTNEHLLGTEAPVVVVEPGLACKKGCA
jgi:hypothetical protein